MPGGRSGLFPGVERLHQSAEYKQREAEDELLRSVGRDRLLELAKAEKDGRLALFPFVAMVEQSMQEGKMTPQKDQRFNGRYAVVYVDKKKWASPLIDICGRAYDREEAEKRRAGLTKEAELKEQEG